MTISLVSRSQTNKIRSLFLFVLTTTHSSLFREDLLSVTQPARKSMCVRLSLKLYFFTHRSMHIFNADSRAVFSFETNQKRGLYEISKNFELILFVLFLCKIPEFTAKQEFPEVAQAALHIPSNLLFIGLLSRTKEAVSTSIRIWEFPSKLDLN